MMIAIEPGGTLPEQRQSPLPRHRRTAGALPDRPIAADHRPGDGSGAPRALRISRVRAHSANDFPGHRAAVLHCAGEGATAASDCDYTWGAIEYFLHRWSGTLSGLVFAGDVPATHADLPLAISRSRALGYAVALQTRGDEPGALGAVLPLVDWVSLEIPVEEGLSSPGRWNSLVRLLSSEVPYECRSYVRRGSHSRDQLLSLGRQLAASGVRRYTVCVATEEGERAGLAGWESLAALFPEFRLQPG
jgi:hypothetical protein